MPEFIESESLDLVQLAADVVSSYVTNNSIPPTDLPEIILSVHRALSNLKNPDNSKFDQIEKPSTAQIKKSITHDALISFEDGKPYKTLRRHLMTRGLTPETYRAKHGLPVDYPMTSASYSAQRSELARSLGLGQRQKGASKIAEPDEAVSEVLAEKKKAGRPRKAS